MFKQFQTFFQLNYIVVCHFSDKDVWLSGREVQKLAAWRDSLSSAAQAFPYLLILGYLKTGNIVRIEIAFTQTVAL